MLYHLSSRIKLKITSGVKIEDVNKLLFAFAGGFGLAMITFFNPFNLFQALFIISLGSNGFEYSGVIGFIEAEVKVSPKSI